MPATVPTGIAALPAVVSLRRTGPGPEAVGPAQAPAALHGWTFLLGRDFLPAVNAVSG